MRPSDVIRTGAVALLLAGAGCGGNGQAGKADAGVDGADLGGDQGSALCTVDADCAAGEICSDGVCRTDDSCQTTADCPAGMVCNRVTQTCIDGDCTADADCGPGYNCVEHRCQSLCRDVECPTGQACQSETGECAAMTCTVDGTDCAGAATCPEGLFCDPLAGGCTECPPGFFCNIHQCVALNPDCRAHSDCGAGERCNPETERCEPYPDSCQTDADCTPQYCNLYSHTCQREPFTGECATDAECQQAFGPDYYCHPRLHNCVLPLPEDGCYDTPDCDDPDLVCDLKTNTCAPRGTVCGVDADCDPEEVCVNGVCVFQCQVSCETEAECAAGEVCRNGCCLEDKTCSDDWDCTAPEECIDGWCQEPLPCLADDDFEDNDSGAAATDLPLPAQDSTDVYPGRYICPQDDDWYAVDVPAGASLTVTILFPDANGDLDMKLYDDPAGGSAIDSSTGVADSETVGATAAADTTYYVKVYGWAGAENGYDLELTHGEGGSSACANDDAFEQNDDWQTASPLALPAVGDTASHPNLIICAGDDDWYAVDVPAGGELTARILFTDAQGDLDLKLYRDPTGSSVDSSTSVGDSEQVADATAVDRTYYIYVYGYGDAGNVYSLELEHAQTGVNPCSPDDGHEENDAAFNATPIRLPPEGEAEVRPDLILCPGDEDWFAVEVPAGEALEARIKFDHDQGDLELELLDAQLDLVDSSSGAGDGEIVRIEQVGADAVFYVRIYGSGGAGADYQLEIRNPGGVVVDCSDGGYEPNDDAAAATGLAAGSHPGLFVCNTQPPDEDWYAVDLLAGERLHARIDFDAADGDLDLYLYDAGGANELDSSTSGYADSEQVDGPRLAADTQLLVQVVGSGLSRDVGYDLTLTVDPPVDCSDGGYEPNDDAADATPLPAGVYPSLNICQGPPQDEDWYRVAAAAGERLSAAIHFDQDEGDLDLYLYDASGSTELDSSTAYYADDEAVSGPRAAADTSYLVRVLGASLDDDTTYALTVELEALDCSDGGDEPNDAPAEATPLAAGLYPDRLICETDPLDEDWYAVDLLDGERLHARIDFDDAQADLDLYLYDASGTIEHDSSTASYADSEQVDGPRASGAATYLVRVAADAYGFDTDAYYQLELWVDPPLQCADDAFEPNDDLAAATALAPPGSAPMVLCPGNLDFFVTQAQRGDLLTFLLVNTTGLGDIDLVLYDADGVELARSDDSGTGAEHIDQGVYQDGPLYAAVVGHQAGSDQVVDYRLDLYTDSFSPCDNDAQEPNDNAYQATDLNALAGDPGGGTWSHSLPGLELCDPGPADWFAVELEAGDSLGVDLRFDHSAGDIDARLYDPNLDQVDSSASASDDEHLETPAAGAAQTGRHYIEVYMYSDDVTSSYDLEVDASRP